MKKTLSMFLALPLMFAAGCDGENTTEEPKVDENVEACKTVIETKLTAHQAELANWSITDLAKMHSVAKDDEGNEVGFEHICFAGRYRDDLSKHPGCAPQTAYTGKLFLNGTNQAEVAPGVPVQGTDAAAPGYVPGYPCAAKEYSMPAGVAVDAAKPIVILVHGNSANPNSFEEFSNPSMTDQNDQADGKQLKSASKFEFTVDAQTREMLAAKLVKQGFRTIAVDLRTDKTLALAGANLLAGGTDPNFGDGIGNVDHGWSVPILQALVKAVMEANPNAKVSLVGHSLGYTVIQDALRRLYVDFKEGKSTLNPFPQVKDVLLASGAAHGVANGNLNCSFYKTMRGSVNCEMGDRKDYVATDYNKLLNGPGDLFSVPCADGSFAYGLKDQCGGNVVSYSTITMKDPVGGELQDEFVSEAASRLDMDQTQTLSDGTRRVTAAACVDNHLIELSDYDGSGYFMDGLPGFLASHFGSIRSEAGMAFILSKLND